MNPTSWKPPRKNVRVTAFREIVSGRASRLVWRHKETVWVARSGLDPRAWFLKLDEQGRGTGGWIHGRPWIDDLLRPPAAILRTRGQVLTRLRGDLKSIHRRSLHPLPDDWLESKESPKVEGLAPATLPRLVRLWPEVVEVLALWATRSAIRPGHARFAYARIRKAEYQLDRIEVRRAEVYRRCAPHLDARHRRALMQATAPRAMLISSAEALDGVLAALPTDSHAQLLDSLAVACSPRLAELARQRGFSRVTTASAPTAMAMLDTLEAWTKDNHSTGFR